jgi:hypothetical protein
MVFNNLLLCVGVKLGLAGNPLDHILGGVNEHPLDDGQPELRILVPAQGTHHFRVFYTVTCIMTNKKNKMQNKLETFK